MIHFIKFISVFMIFLLLILVSVATAAPFPGKQTVYDEVEARKLLNLAAAAYGKQHTNCLNKTFPLHEERQVLLTIAKQCDHLDNTCESYVVISNSTKELNIVFRGTKTKAQLLLEGWDSIQPGVDFFEMGKVNRYFLNAHLILWPEIEQVLKDPAYADYTTVFTGHSLGGALASLAAARTVRQGFRSGGQVKIITFGQPRVGTLEYATNFDTMIPYSFRVVFRRDIVPHLPACHKTQSSGLEDDNRPCDSSAGDKSYHHGIEIWYPDSMEIGASYRECTGLPKNEDFTCSDRLKFRYDQTSSYIWDHRHYFGVRVPEYGKAGCDATIPEGKPGVFDQVLCLLSPAPHCEEHLLEKSADALVVPWEILNAPKQMSSSDSRFRKFFPLFLILLALI